MKASRGVTSLATQTNQQPAGGHQADRRPVVFWDFKILIDYQCPICRREAKFLRRLDRGRRRLAFEDITRTDFDPSKYGRTMNDVRSAIHGVTAEGTVVSGVEVFRRAYAAVGYGWLMKPTEWPMLRQLSDVGYRWFARNRYRISRLFGDTREHRHCDPERDTCRI